MDESQAQALRERIDRLYQRVEEAARVPGAFAYLPDIVTYLDILKRDVSARRDLRDRHSAGFGRILTEDFSFSESSLGSDLIKLADDYASLPD